jgi:pilus assembly protein CpaE
VLTTVSLVGGVDRNLEEQLRACGTQVTIIGAGELAALTHPTAAQPHVLVVDQRHRSEVAAELAAIKRQHPATGVLMVLPHLDPALMLEAMRAGVNECVVEPVSQDDLAAALQRIAAKRPAPRRGSVFAVVGAKGGVGATTVAVNVATMLRKLKPTNTLLIDLHLIYGDAGVFLGVEPRFSVVDALENMHRMDASFFRTLVTQTESGLHLLGSSDRPATAAVDAGRIRALIELAATEFPNVVLDLPRSDTTVLDALEPVDTIVVVANQEVATVRSAGRMATLLEQRYGRERVSVVISRYDASAEIRQNDVERVVCRPVSYVFPNNYPVAVAALNKGRPLVLDGSNNRLASAFSGFARSLAGMPEERTESKTSSLFSLIGGRR